MPELNYLDDSIRTRLLEEIESYENIDRKKLSFAQVEIIQDRVYESVRTYLKAFYTDDTLKEMPIFGSINLAKRIVENEAAVYKTAPERTFEGVSEEQALVLRQVYKDLCLDEKMVKANQFLKAQDQTHINITISNKKLKCRNILNHQLDVVPASEDPEMGEAYILSGYDKATRSPDLFKSDNTNLKIADKDDGDLTRFVLWSKQNNFIMNKTGAIVSPLDEIDNKIGLIPFVDISYSKTNEYWIRSGTSLTDFTIQWNASLSDLAHIVRMQGFAQAWFKGNINTIPERLVIGPSHVLKLGIDPNNPTETDFGFANPSPDLSGSIQFVEVLLSAFLTSRGLDPKLVNTKGDSKQSFSSGVERLLSMVDMFGPAKADFPLFEDAEAKVFEIVKAYLNTYEGSDVLEYKIGKIPEDAKVRVKYHEPQMIMTESDKLDLIQKKTELGLITRKQSIMDLYEVEEEQADVILKDLDAEIDLLAPKEVPAVGV